MSNVFKRPMFRRGGGVNMNGIMSGIRDEYEDGGPTARERYEQIIKNYENPAMDPLSKLLIQGGLRGLSETRGGGTLANLAMAFQEPTDQLFSDLQRRKDLQREAELAGLEMDIADEKERKARMQALEDATTKFERDKELLQQEITGEKDIESIKEKDQRTEQVTPAFENVVDSLTSTLQESKNPAVKAAPNQTAFNLTRFRREASPEVLSKYKGFKPYTFDNKGKIMPLPIDRYNPGDIIYDPLSSDFLIFDNAGGTYKLDPLTFEIQE